jgi:hypothetical protein
MTAFYFFETQLFVLYTSLGHLGLVLASGATAALTFILKARLGARPSATSKLSGAFAAAAVAALLTAGLRVRGTAYDPLAPAMLWEWLAAAAAGAGLAATAYALTAAVVGALTGGPQTPGAAVLPAASGRDDVGAALVAFETLKAACERLRLSEKEAEARAAQVTDGVAAAEYTKAAEAIRHRHALAEELKATAGAAVLRLACASPLRRLLERRPDAVLSRLNDLKQAAPLVARVDESLLAVRSFLGEVERARLELSREARGAEGSVAARVGLDASARVQPFDAAAVQLEATYGRVGHRLEALRLRIRAEADAGAAAGAALAMSGPGQPAPSQDVVAVAMEISQAEQSAVTALTTLGAQPSRIAEVVVNASASFARDSGDDEALADVLRSVRRELEH